MAHDSRSEELVRALIEIDSDEFDDYFCWKLVVTEIIVFSTIRSERKSLI